MPRSQRTKLVLKDLGDPSLLKAQPESVTEYVTGILIGEASGFVERSAPNGDQKFEGLAGRFRSMPSDPEREELESGVLFIPDAFHNQIAAQLRQLREGYLAKGADGQPIKVPPDPAARVEFVFEVSVIRAKNPQGYSWSFRPAQEAQGFNPLDSIAANLPLAAERKPGQSMLAPPSNVKQLEQPAAAAGGKRK